MVEENKYASNVMATRPLVGSTPNPASTLAWPMSYSPAVPVPDHYTVSSHGISNASVMASRYDPVHNNESTSNLDSDMARLHSTMASQKRKRMDDKALVKNQALPSAYEPQKLVIPSNSLQSGKRSHVCDMCGATFTRQHNLKSHLLTHTSSKKEFICSECGSEFRRSHDLKRHQKLHTGEKPFACSTCGRKFARADALGRHTKSAGDGGCVNNRKTSDTADTPSDSQIEAIDTSTTIDTERNAPVKESQLSVVGHVPERRSSDQISPHVDGRYPPSILESPQEGTSNHTIERSLPATGNTTLPPLHTAFGYESDRSYVPTPPTRDIMSAARFGLATSFDARPVPTHPLSFDRGTIEQSSSAAGVLPTSAVAHAQPMVPLLRYRQLEAEHLAAMERIRHFEEDQDHPRSVEREFNDVSRTF